MESLIDLHGLPLRAGGDIVKLPTATPAGYLADRTVLVKIDEPSPRVMRARLKRFGTLLQDGQILTEFNNNGGWSNLPNHGNSETQLCMNVTEVGRDKGVLLALQLSHPQHSDTFIHPGPNPHLSAEYAVLGIDGQDRLYKPAWVGAAPDFKTVSVFVAMPRFSIDYILGVNVAGTGGSKPTPLFVDPKIENNG